jgi:hypothetical protein
MVKETYQTGKRDLSNWEKRPIKLVKETYQTGKRDPLVLVLSIPEDFEAVDSVGRLHNASNIVRQSSVACTRAAHSLKSEYHGTLAMQRH